MVRAHGRAFQWHVGFLRSTKERNGRCAWTMSQPWRRRLDILSPAANVHSGFSGHWLPARETSLHETLGVLDRQTCRHLQTASPPAEDTALEPVARKATCASSGGRLGNWGEERGGGWEAQEWKCRQDAKVWPFPMFCRRRGAQSRCGRKGGMMSRRTASLGRNRNNTCKRRCRRQRDLVSEYGR